VTASPAARRTGRVGLDAGPARPPSSGGVGLLPRRPARALVLGLVPHEAVEDGVCGGDDAGSGGLDLADVDGCPSGDVRHGGHPGRQACGIPDQNGRRRAGDDGETPMPADPQLTDLLLIGP
jgi:hypothetical protein